MVVAVVEYTVNGGAAAEARGAAVGVAHHGDGALERVAVGEREAESLESGESGYGGSGVGGAGDGGASLWGDVRHGSGHIAAADVLFFLNIIAAGVRYLILASDFPVAVGGLVFGGGNDGDGHVAAVVLVQSRHCVGSDKTLGEVDAVAAIDIGYVAWPGLAGFQGGGFVVEHCYGVGRGEGEAAAETVGDGESYLVGGVAVAGGDNHVDRGRGGSGVSNGG